MKWTIAMPPSASTRHVVESVDSSKNFSGPFDSFDAHRGVCRVTQHDFDFARDGTASAICRIWVSSHEDQSSASPRASLRGGKTEASRSTNDHYGTVF